MRAQLRVRKNKGAGLVFGIGAIGLIITMSMLLTVLVVNSSYVLLVQEKLDRANKKTAAFAAAHAQDSNLEVETESYAANALSDMQIAPSNTSVSITSTGTAAGTSVLVKLSNLFHIPSSGGLLPNQATMSNVRIAEQTSTE